MLRHELAEIEGANLREEEESELQVQRDRLQHVERLRQSALAAYEALTGIDRINSDYPKHAKRAAEIAREHFDARRVLPRLVEDACA